MFSDRESLRREFQIAWHNYKARKPLQPHQVLITQVVEMHPEYQRQIEQRAAIDEDFDGQDGRANPFLHMGMHIAIREQLQTGLPQGITAIHRRLCKQLGSTHEAEHRMLECLGETLWQAQRERREPNMEHYLSCLKKLLRRPD